MKELNRLLDRGRARGARFVAAAVFGVLAALVSATSGEVARRVQDTLERARELSERGLLTDRLLLLGAGVVLLAAVMAACSFASRWLYADAALRVLMHLRADLYETLLHKPMSWLTRRHGAELVSRVTNDVQRIETGLAMRLSDLVANAPIIPALIVYLWILNPVLAIFATIVLPVSGILVRRWSRRVKRASRRSQEEVGVLSNVLAETLHGIRIVKAHGAQAHEQRRFGVVNESMRAISMKAHGTVAMSAPVLDLLGAVVLAALVMIAGYQVEARRMDSSDFTAFFVTLALLYKSIKKTMQSFTELQNTTAAAARCFEILDDPEHEPGGRTEAPPLSEGISLRNVMFAYGDAPVLTNVTFDIPKGRVVALVGESGSGKSTLTNLVARFHDVTGGSITWDGVDLREITPASLRKQIGLVTQDTIVFDDTVAANIAYADSAPDLERVKSAARAAHADEFIRELERGYDTRLGQAGSRLSGGQRQRIAMARALYRDAPLLILDEATSNLDSHSESLVQEALSHLLRGRTALVVAHRLSTVQAADEIIVLSAGRIVQRGVHRELIQREGPYQQLHLLQSGTA